MEGCNAIHKIIKNEIKSVVKELGWNMRSNMEQKHAVETRGSK